MSLPFGNESMLLDLNNPRSKAIFAAARELDALQGLWQKSEFQSPEIDVHIANLRAISAAEFQDSQFIRKWLDELRLAFQDKQEQLYRTATEHLDSDAGFETVFI